MSQRPEPKVAPHQLGEPALRELVEAAFDALVITRQAVVVFANRSFCEMGGWSPDDVLGRSVVEFVAPESRAAVIERMKSGDEARYEARGLRKDGTTIAVEICARQCVYQGEAARVTAIRYIEDRKRAEEALRRSEARLREVIERLPDMILVHRGGTIVFANPALVRYLRYDCMDQLVGRSVWDLTHPDDREAARERANTSYQTREPGPLATFRTVRRDGSPGVIELVSAPIEFDDAPAVLVIARDIADRKQMEARLLQADLLASMGMLAAGITHEINNPLAYILLNVDLLSARIEPLLKALGAGTAPPPSPELTQVAGEISRLLADTRDGAFRVKRIVHDFRVFARGGDGRPRLCDVREVLDATVKLTLNELRHRARLVRTYHSVPLVNADEARLCQLFLNLLVNALQALPEGADPEHAEICVGTHTADDGSAVVEIDDTGVGIPGHLMDRVFEPFFSTKPAGLGTGLGLSICQSVVNALGGRIELSNLPNGGARCRVTLPAARVVEGAHDEPAPPAAATAAPRLRLLLVDDEERLLAALAQDLCREYEVEEAASGAAAIDKIRERAFDIVVCDLMMPGTSGADVYEAARTHRPGLERRFVFMTGGAFTAGTRQFFERVRNPRLEKPFELIELHSVLRELLRSTPS